MIKCKKCGNPSYEEVCWECSDPIEFFNLYYKKNKTILMGQAPYPNMIYQPIDNVDIPVHQIRTKEKCDLINKVDFKGKNYVDLGCSNGYYALHINAGKCLGIDYSKNDIILALKTRDAMKISENKVKFSSDSITPNNIYKFLAKADIVTLLGMHSIFINQYGIDATKDIIRYIFGTKEVIIEQSHIPYEVFVKWTGIKDFRRDEYTMNNPLVLHLMIKTCIGFVPEFEILGEIEYDPTIGLPEGCRIEGNSIEKEKRVIIYYKMDKELNEIRYGKDKPNVIYRNGDSVFKFIPDEKRRNADCQCNLRLGRAVELIDSKLLKFKYFKPLSEKDKNDLNVRMDSQTKTLINSLTNSGLKPKDESLKELLSNIDSGQLKYALDRCFSAGIIPNEFLDNLVLTESGYEPVDFEIAGIDYNLPELFERVTKSDIDTIATKFENYYFSSEFRKNFGTAGMKTVIKDYIEFRQSKK